MLIALQVQSLTTTKTIQEKKKKEKTHHFQHSQHQTSPLKKAPALTQQKPLYITCNINIVNIFCKKILIKKKQQRNVVSICSSNLGIQTFGQT